MPNQRSPLPLALAMTAGYLVAAGLLGAGLLAAHGSTAVPGTAVAAVTTSQGPPAGFAQTTGPAKLTTVVPTGWQISPIRNGFQADDPAGGGNKGRFVRYQGVTSNADLYVWLNDYEAKEWAKQPGYRRIVLAKQDFQGSSAVRWEFEYDLDGQHRHVEILYWQSGDTQYDVYASAPATQWQQTASIFDAMVANSAVR